MNIEYTVTVVNKVQSGEHVLTTVVLQGNGINSQLTLSDLVDNNDYNIGNIVTVDITVGGK